MPNLLYLIITTNGDVMWLTQFFTNAVDVDECVSSPCTNRGTCEDGDAMFTCSCVHGFKGTFCEGKYHLISDISYLALPCLAYPVVSVDRWGATDDLATSSLHSSRLSAFLMAAPSV